MDDEIHTGKTRDVLIVGDFADVNGGQAKVAIDSARMLADAGLTVTFFAGTGPISPLLDHPGVNTVCLDQHTILDNPSRIRAMASGLWNAAALRALKDTIVRFDPASTVLHCHGWAKSLSPSVGRVLAGGPLPVLYTMHEYFLACPNGGFFDYRTQQICTRTALSSACLSVNCDARHVSHKAWRVARSAIARGIGHLPGGLTDIAYISKTQRNVMASYLPAGAHLHHVPNPVAQSGRPVDAGANKNFVFVGRLSPEKGAAMFAQAARQADVPAVFVGDGPEAARIREVNPDAKITGWVSPDDVQEQLSMARAVVFPSLWYECQPLVPIESLLRGVPVVCGSWGAASEVIEDGVNGVLYHNPTVDDLVAAMQKVQAIGKFETSDLSEFVAPKNHVAKLLEIYDGMLDRRASQSH